MGAAGLGDALRARDMDLIDAVLADDVVFYSPVIKGPPFTGRAAVRWIFRVAVENFALDPHRVLDGGDVQVLLSTGTVRGEPLSAVLVLDVDRDGLVTAIHTHVRPLRALARIALVVGTALAEREGGRGLRTVAGGAARPLVGYADTATAVGRRLISRLNRDLAE